MLSAPVTNALLKDARVEVNVRTLAREDTFQVLEHVQNLSRHHAAVVIVVTKLINH